MSQRGRGQKAGAVAGHTHDRVLRSQDRNPQMLYVAGRTGHTEVVRVVFHPDKVSFANLLKVFWENHDPTQGTALTCSLNRGRTAISEGSEVTCT